MLSQLLYPFKRSEKKRYKAGNLPSKLAESICLVLSKQTQMVGGLRRLGSAYWSGPKGNRRLLFLPAHPPALSLRDQTVTLC